ncbi:hypothetical protein [Nitrosopumilus sp.]|uniref:hypothetical protein n=1 Tax=Nitrosopumilus sp. TaxID=2024843 RepID=UPI003B5BDCDB
MRIQAQNHAQKQGIQREVQKGNERERRQKQSQENFNEVIVMAGCNEICSRYKAQPKGTRPARYSAGQKRCQICEIFIEWKGCGVPVAA